MSERSPKFRQWGGCGGVCDATVFTRPPEPGLRGLSPSHPTAATYIGMIRHNVSTIVQALQ